MSTERKYDKEFKKQAVKLANITVVKQKRICYNKNGDEKWKR